MSKYQYDRPIKASEIVADIMEVLLFLRSLRDADTPLDEYIIAVQKAAPAFLRLLVWYALSLSPGTR